MYSCKWDDETNETQNEYEQVSVRLYQKLYQEDF